MANRRRETPEERAERDRRERIELLKMKQGLIEESEMIPESGYAGNVEEGVFSKISSFVYRNKIFIVLGVIFAAIAIFLIMQFILREREDMHILLVAYDRESEMYFYKDDIEKALEMYCPDFDGNGNVHVSINFIDRTTRDGGSQYDDMERQKLTSELEYGTAQLVITDEGFVERINFDENKSDEDAMRDYFVEQTGLPEEELFCGVGVRANKTKFAANAGWKDCPDNVIILVRDEVDVTASNDKENAENRARAQIVLQNILDNNIVNPAE